MHYKIEELDFKNGSEEEQIRTRKIFEDLKLKALDNRELSEHEKDFLCLGVKLSQKNDGKLGDYSCCENFKFKETYLSYFQDLRGSGVYRKARGIKLYEPSEFEVKKDLAYLERISNNWAKTITKTNHSDSLLQETSKEARSELKEIENSKGKLFFRREKENHLLRKKALLLQSKFIHCIALQIFERFDRKELTFNLNEVEIEINEYSIIHILNRHFAKVTKTNPTKSFHNEDFEPHYLNKKLEEIFKKIDDSGLYINQSIHKVCFRYNGTIYLVWINERVKQLKNIGNVSFNRLETFYPVTDLGELETLERKYIMREIDPELALYVKSNDR